MAYVEYTAYVNNASYGSVNAALMTFHLLAGTEPAQEVVSAQICAFISYCALADQSSVVAMTRRAEGSAGSTPVAFGVAEFAALRAVDAGLPNLTAYAINLGGFANAALGLGMTVNEYTAIPGRHTTGRLYTPYVNAASIGGDGLTTATARTNCIDGYGAYLLDNGTNSASVPLSPVVFSPATNTSTLIQQVTVSAAPSRLKTRTR